jgi:hypothetical protein
LQGRQPELVHGEGTQGSVSQLFCPLKIFRPSGKFLSADDVFL